MENTKQDTATATQVPEQYAGLRARCPFCDALNSWEYHSRTATIHNCPHFREKKRSEPGGEIRVVFGDSL